MFINREEFKREAWIGLKWGILYGLIGATMAWHLISLMLGSVACQVEHLGMINRTSALATMELRDRNIAIGEWWSGLLWVVLAIGGVWGLFRLAAPGFLTRSPWRWSGSWGRSLLTWVLG